MSLTDVINECRFEEIASIKHPYDALRKHAEAQHDHTTLLYLAKPLAELEQAFRDKPYMSSLDAFDEWIVNQTVERCELYLERAMHIDDKRQEHVRNYIKMYKILDISE